MTRKNDRAKLMAICLGVILVISKLRSSGGLSDESGPIDMASQIRNEQILLIQTRRQLSDSQANIQLAKDSLTHALPNDGATAALMLRKRVYAMCETLGIDLSNVVGEPEIVESESKDELFVVFAFTIDADTNACLQLLDMLGTDPGVAIVSQSRLSSRSQKKGDLLRLEVRLEAIASKQASEDFPLGTAGESSRTLVQDDCHERLGTLLFPINKAPVSIQPVLAQPLMQAEKRKPVTRIISPKLVLVGTIQNSESSKAFFFDPITRRSITVRRGEELRIDRFAATVIGVSHKGVFLKMKAGFAELLLSQSLESIPQHLWLVSSWQTAVRDGAI